MRFKDLREKDKIKMRFKDLREKDKIKIYKYIIKQGFKEYKFVFIMMGVLLVNLSFSAFSNSDPILLIIDLSLFCVFLFIVTPLLIMRKIKKISKNLKKFNWGRGDNGISYEITNYGSNRQGDKLYSVEYVDGNFKWRADEHIELPGCVDWLNEYSRADKRDILIDKILEN